MRVHNKISFLNKRGPRDNGRNRGGAVGALQGRRGPTVALHARRGRGGNEGGRSQGVRLGAAGAPNGTVEGAGPQGGIGIPDGMDKTIIQMMDRNATAKTATRVADIMRVALGQKSTAKTGTTVPSIGKGPQPGTTVRGGGVKISTKVQRAQPSYSALGGAGGGEAGGLRPLWGFLP